MDYEFNALDYALKHAWNDYYLVPQGSEVGDRVIEAKAGTDFRLPGLFVQSKDTFATMSFDRFNKPKADHLPLIGWCANATAKTNPRDLAVAFFNALTRYHGAPKTKCCTVFGVFVSFDSDGDVHTDPVDSVQIDLESNP